MHRLAHLGDVKFSDPITGRFLPGDPRVATLEVVTSTFKEFFPGEQVGGEVFQRWARQNYPDIFQRYFTPIVQHMAPVTTTPTAPRALTRAEQRAAETKRIAEAKATETARLRAMCELLPPIGPLEDLEMTMLKIPVRTGERAESAFDRREEARELAARVKAIKLHALGLGPVPRGGMPTSGANLWWVPELERKRYACGPASFTAEETAFLIRTKNEKIGELHRAARKRRKRKIKKIVAIAGLAVAAVYLGPMISGAVKGTAAAEGVTGAAAAKAAAAKAIAVKAAAAKGVIAAKVVTAGKVVTGIEAARKLATAQQTVEAASIVTRAQEIIPKVVNVANNVRTIKAVADGEIPPPPITLEGDSFREYAVSLGQQILEKEIADKREELTQVQAAAMRRDLEIETRRLQIAAQRELPVPSQMVSYPIGAVAPAVDQSIAEAPGTDDMMKMALVALPIVAMVFMRA